MNKVWVLQKVNIGGFVAAFYLFETKPSKEVLDVFTLNEDCSIRLLHNSTVVDENGEIGWILSDRKVHKGELGQ